MALNFTDTVETIREKLYSHVRKNPGDTLEMLLRGVTNSKEETPIADVFAGAAKDKDSILIQAFLSMQPGDMVGAITANENTAKRLAATLYDWLKSEPTSKRTKSEIEAKLFPGVIMEKNPQGKADLEEAYRQVYVMPHIARFTKDGDKADKRWTTIQFVSAEKPAPLTPKK